MKPVRFEVFKAEIEVLQVVTPCSVAGRRNRAQAGTEMMSLYPHSPSPHSDWPYSLLPAI